MSWPSQTPATQSSITRHSPWRLDSRKEAEKKKVCFSQKKRAYLFALLGLGAGARLDALGNRAVDVVVRDPFGVKVGTAGSAGGLVAGEGLGGLDLDDLLGLLGPGALGLGEQGLDPGLVDKVEGTGKGGAQDEVQEDAVEGMSVTCVSVTKGVA